MAPPPSPLMDELVEEVLLRVPPEDPARLSSAELVCKPWCRVATNPGFRRRYRERHRAPPMLGVLCNLDGDDAPTARFVPTSSFRPPRAGGHGWFALDSRHGRVLLGKDGFVGNTTLAVWDPITGDTLELPEAPWHDAVSWNAAVLCAAAAGGAGACGHLDCRSGHFLVAVVVANIYSVFAHLYSSESGRWSQPTQRFGPQHFRQEFLDHLSRSALVGNALYFDLVYRDSILKYDLSTREVSVINLPLQEDIIMLVITEKDGELGFATMHRSKLYMWVREASPDRDERWVQTRVINLETLLPASALTIKPRVVGFADGVEVFFVRTANGLFSIDLKFGQVRKVHEDTGIRNVVTYVNFCTPALGDVSTGEGPEAGASSA